MELFFKNSRRVAVIVLNDNDCNIFSETFIIKLIELFKIADSSEAKIIEISSGNRVYFSKGPDLFALDKQNMKLTQAVALLRRLAEKLNSFILQLVSSDKLVITLFNGVVFGGGLNIFLGSDLRLSTQRTKIFENFSQFGLTLDLSASYFFQKFMSLAEIQKILFKDDFINAKTAVELGIFHECFETYKDLEVQLNIIEHWSDKKINTIVQSNKLMINTDILQEQLLLETNRLIESFESGGNDFEFN
ncbi:enoyl-CoA hydratase/isomerase family protein [Streptococcus mutans]|nr:enoyl-CoA hydratase/isomerase family protein [Streptococcus mutans]